MSTAAVPLGAPSETASEHAFQRLESTLRFGQGTFSLGLVGYNLSSIPPRLNARLRGAFPELNLVCVDLAPFPPDSSRDENVLDQLRQWVRLLSPDRAPDALLISGLHRVMDQDFWRAVAPLNMGRNLLQRDYPCPVIFWLPLKQLGDLFNSAPDLVSWVGLQLIVRADLEDLERRCRDVAAKPFGRIELSLRLRRRSELERRAEVEELETLLVDSRAAGYSPELVAPIQRRLGLVMLSLDDHQAAFPLEAFERAAREIGDAEWMRQASWALARARPMMRQPEAFRTVGRAAVAAALGPSDPVIGREAELDALLSRVVGVVPRFQIVWGETGCGKSSLVRVGLVPRLKARGMDVVVVDDGYERLEEQLAPHVPPPHGKTVVFVLDQFERLFHGPTREQRRSAFEYIGHGLLRGARFPCRVVVVVREDDLGRLAELDNFMHEPLEAAKRFYVPLFDRRSALAVLRHIKHQCDQPWSDELVAQVVDDLLSGDERVRPVDVQLVAASMQLHAVATEAEYYRAGAARGLLDGFIDGVIAKGPNGLDREQWGRLLLMFVGEDGRRKRRTLSELRERLEIRDASLAPAIAWLQELRMLQSVGSTWEMELAHDELARRIVSATRTLQDNMQLASIWLREAKQHAHAQSWVGLRWSWKAPSAARFPELWNSDESLSRFVRALAGLQPK